MIGIKSILQIPVATGNNIFLVRVDFDKKLLLYRRGFNPGQLIEESYEVFGGQVRTGLINFHVNWLTRYEELIKDQENVNVQSK